MEWCEIKDLFDTIDGAYGVGQLELTAWESDFYDSTSMQFSSKDTLSDKQIDILKRIIDKIG